MLFCFFLQFSILKNYMHLQGNTTWLFPIEYGFLGPYRGQRYHLQEFRRRGQPQTREEIFNRMHFSLHCVIERTFGV